MFFHHLPALVISSQLRKKPVCKTQKSDHASLLCLPLRDLVEFSTILLVRVEPQKNYKSERKAKKSHTKMW